jgi:hypothetical protein
MCPAPKSRISVSYAYKLNSVGKVCEVVKHEPMKDKEKFKRWPIESWVQSLAVLIRSIVPTTGKVVSWAELPSVYE